MKFLNVWPLRFSDKIEEARFIIKYRKESAQFNIAAMMIGSFIYAIFSVVDALVYPQYLPIFMTYRLTIIPLSLLVFLMHKKKNYYKRLNSVSVFMSGYALYGIVFMSTFKGVHTYQPGMMLVMFFVYMTFRIRVLHSTIICTSALLAYLVFKWTFNPCPIVSFIVKFFFLNATNVFGILTAYTIEYHFRKDFKRQREMNKKNQELKLMTEKLKLITHEDPLTGLKNERFLNIFLKPESDAFIQSKLHGNRKSDNADSKENVFGVFYVNIRNFRHINSTLGKSVGDVVLMQISNVIKHSCRMNDIVCRLKDDKFVIILRNMDNEYGKIYATKVVNKIRNYYYDVLQEYMLKIECNVGFVYFPFYRSQPHALDLASCMKLAKTSSENSLYDVTHVKEGLRVPHSFEHKSIFESDLGASVKKSFVEIDEFNC